MGTSSDGNEWWYSMSNCCVILVKKINLSLQIFWNLMIPFQHVQNTVFFSTFLEFFKQSYVKFLRFWEDLKITGPFNCICVRITHFLCYKFSRGGHWPWRPTGTCRWSLKNGPCQILISDKIHTLIDENWAKFEP